MFLVEVKLFFVRNLLSYQLEEIGFRTVDITRFLRVYALRQEKERGSRGVQGRNAHSYARLSLIYY